MHFKCVCGNHPGCTDVSEKINTLRATEDREAVTCPRCLEMMSWEDEGSEDD